MEAPVYQDLSWNTVPQPCKEKDYRMLEQRRNLILQNLQQTPDNRVELEKQLHSVNTEMYMYQNTQKHSYNEYIQGYGRKEHDSDLMDILGMPQSGSSWNKQLIDSGFVSGSTTSPPSDDGGNTDYQAGIDEELAFWEAGPYKASYNPSQSRSQRLRAELFPDASEEPPAQHPSPSTPGTLQTQGEPSSTPPTQPPLENIVHYQDDTELALQAMPEFTKLLASKSNEVLVSVTTCLYQLSKKEASMHAIISYPQLMTSLLHTLGTSTDVEVTRCCVGTLHNLSHLLEGLEAIQKYRGIPVLCDLLCSTVDNVLYYVTTTLHNMIQRHKSAQLDICLSGGIEKLVSCLKHTDKPQLVSLVSECLHFLCYRNPDKKQTVAACSGPLQLVKLLQTSSLEYLTFSVARCLKTLSVCNKNKKCIIEAGGMQALSRHLDTGSQRVTEEVLYTMRNLSNSVKGTSVDNLDPILARLMDVLTRSNTNIIACSVGCLSNLTCNNANNKKTVFRAGGLDTLLRCLLHHQTVPSIAEPLLCTLRHINYKHSEYEQTQHAFRSSGGIALITKVLSTAQHWAVLKAACGLIRNLALNPANTLQFKESGLLLHLIQACLRIKDHYKGGVSDTRDGIRLEDILMESLKTLETVCHHKEIRVQLDNPSTTHLLLKCVNSNNEMLVETALSVMVLFERNDNFMVIIKNDPRFELIGKLCHFRNGKIAQMAGLLAKRLGELQGEGKVSESGPSGGFVKSIVWGGESSLRSESTPGTPHVQDVVDLDATTAQYRNDFIKSPPGSLPAVPPGSQYSPRYHQPYNPPPFPYPGYQGGYHPPPAAYHPYNGYLLNGYQNRNWYGAAM